MNECSDFTQFQLTVHFKVTRFPGVLNHSAAADCWQCALHNEKLSTRSGMQKRWILVPPLRLPPPLPLPLLHPCLSISEQTNSIKRSANDLSRSEVPNERMINLCHLKTAIKAFD